MTFLQRKVDTRRKIQLGGLVIKAGISEQSTAVLLGIMLDAYDKLHSEHADDFIRQWRLQGDIALTDDLNK